MASSSQARWEIPNSITPAQITSLLRRLEIGGEEVMINDNGSLSLLGSITPAQSLITTPPPRPSGVEEQEELNGDIGPTNVLGTRVDIENEFAVHKEMMEASIKKLDCLLAQLHKFKRRPVQCESGGMENRTWSHLVEALQRKIGELEKAIESISSLDLYYLIKNIKPGDWKHLMRALNINDTEIEACIRISPDEREQKYQMLLLWFRKHQDGRWNHKEELIFVLDVLEYRDIAVIFRNGCRKSAPVAICKENI
ncbi:uncharacterized protein LOC134927848 isoform X2 [Pseudophryne corroboree]|uniref:uncharacterized protein LOC134927848 isoform X2 n=1 Tax=Pseudophryne corroboree TaxID=495146 RepID=UPI0030820D0F